MTKKNPVRRRRAVAAADIAGPRYPKRSVLDLVTAVLRYTYRPGGVVAPPAIPFDWLVVGHDEDAKHKK